MKIRVTQCLDREEATVEVVYPGGDEPDRVVSCTELCNGQSVTLTAPEVHEESGIEVGSVTDVPQEED